MFQDRPTDSCRPLPRASSHPADPLDRDRSGAIDPTRRAFIGTALALASGTALSAGKGAEPVLIGIDGEFNLEGSLSAQAVELGVRIAIDEINAQGGVLGGRPFEIVKRSLPIFHTCAS